MLVRPKSSDSPATVPHALPSATPFLTEDSTEDSTLLPPCSLCASGMAGIKKSSVPSAVKNGTQQRHSHIGGDSKIEWSLFFFF